LLGKDAEYLVQNPASAMEDDHVNRMQNAQEARMQNVQFD